MILKPKANKKIQLSITINFLYPENTNEARTMHLKCDNKEIVNGDETDKIMQEFCTKYWKGLEINEG